MSGDVLNPQAHEIVALLEDGILDQEGWAKFKKRSVDLIESPSSESVEIGSPVIDPETGDQWAAEEHRRHWRTGDSRTRSTDNFARQFELKQASPDGDKVSYVVTLVSVSGKEAGAVASPLNEAQPSKYERAEAVIKGIGLLYGKGLDRSQEAS